jgi:hypothetical protein
MPLVFDTEALMVVNHPNGVCFVSLCFLVTVQVPIAGPDALTVS